jgi:osmotically-inducible protein OsmY
LRTELGLGSDRIDVTVQGAQVTVTGNIDSELQRKAIRVLVEGVRGINGFVDRTHI